MRVRDAVEADADAMATLADQPADVMRNLVHDRTVCVAVDELEKDDYSDGHDYSDKHDYSDGHDELDQHDEPDGHGEQDGHDETGLPSTESESPLRAMVSFDARQETVYVTQLAGDREAVEQLLEEPIRFARGEGMDVEAIVAAGDEDGKSAVETKGFSQSGDGPKFDGKPTVRYRLEV